MLNNKYTKQSSFFVKKIIDNSAKIVEIERSYQPKIEILSKTINVFYENYFHPHKMLFAAAMK